MILVGHRGARGEAPENTLAGFAYARRVGVDAVELDVRLSADDQLVVIHDPTVDRTTDRTGPVAGFTAAELAAMDARGSAPDWPEPVGVPTLAAALDLFDDRRLAIEIKRDEPARLARVCAALVAAIAERRIEERVIVTSFEVDALELVRDLAPALPRGLICGADRPFDLDAAVRLGCAQADLPVATGSAEIVRSARARGLRVCGWLGNSPADVRTLVDWGVDAITTDYPTMAGAELRRPAP